ncbi:Mur ligase family protein [Clostridium sp.]|uniref:Mur ligase family protein n=1 Tax=Clostridium sp. TaxID=1506 RepID=UPI002FC982E8
MKIKSMKFYEGFNITGEKSTFKIDILGVSAVEAKKYSNLYIQVSKAVGTEEKVLDIEENEDDITLWLSYSQEEVSEFIWSEMVKGEYSYEIIASGASKFISDKILKAISKEAKQQGVPFVRVSKDSYQVGYGSGSIIIENHNKDKVLNLIKSKSLRNIPVFAITGTNGKTTTTRLLYHMFIKLGYNAGMSNTGSIMIGKQSVETGDTTGYLSSRRLLLDKTVEAAVLETARGGIINNGLGFEEIHGAIITSLSEDHLGLSGVNNLEELIKVKSLILKGVKRDGVWILRAQREILDEARKNLEDESFVSKAILFDIDKNPLIEQHVSLGGEAMYLQENHLIHHKNGVASKVAEIDKIAFTHEALSLSNVRNVMAVLLALGSIGNPMKHLVRLISSIPCDIIHNPGRQNILEIGEVKVLIDYGHNAEAYKAIYSIVEGLKPSKVTSIITAPGDRQDTQIEELGYISGSKSDYIIIREQADKRGSQRGRVAELMTKGALSAGKKENEITYESHAGEALIHALEKPVNGEVIVLFAEYLRPVVECLNEYIKKYEKGQEISVPILSL